MGERARDWCEKNASYNAMRPKLKAIIQGVVQARSPKSAKIGNSGIG